jgi:hypothetical protein
VVVRDVQGRLTSRRRRIAEFCHSLPEVTSSGDQHICFRVPNKTFAYLLEDHHGDGRMALNCKVERGSNSAIISSDPDHFFFPPYVGPRGWIGLWLDLDDIDWDEVSELIVDSYRLTAPKRLVAQLEQRLH